MTQATARGFGVVFLLIGALGLVTTPFSMTSELLFGLFPVNVLHNLVHLAFGGWGLVASGTPDRAIAYYGIGGITYLTLALVGLLTPTGFGLMPLGGHDVWLHAVLGAILTAASFLNRPSPAPIQR